LTPFDITQFQPKAWTILSRAFAADRVAGTYLFHGRDGFGHWPLAVALAALLNCDKPVQSDLPDGELRPCGTCRHCRAIYNLNFQGLLVALPLPPAKTSNDTIELTNEILANRRREPFCRLSAMATTNIPIATAREIKRSLSRKAPDGITRLALFDRMEKMRADSADALLKMIEEPPSDTVIVLTAERPEALLPTIQSRAQRIRLERIRPDTIEQYLIQNYDLSEKRARLLGRISDGSLGQAIELIDSGEESDTSRRAVGFMLFKALLTEDAPSVVAHLAELVNPRDRGEAEDLLRLWQSLIRDCSRFAQVGEEQELTNIDFAADLKRLSTHFVDSRVAAAMSAQIKISLADLGLNVHILGSLTALALKLKASVVAAR
jgi:DNA polymerase-3 subunit delta'